MNIRVRLFWALVLTVAAALGSYMYLKGLRQEVTVVVADRDIQPHTLIKAEMVRTVRISASARSAVLPTAIGNPDKVVGAVAVQEIPRGEVLRDDPRWLTREKAAVQAATQTRLSYFLPEGTRAVTIMVDGPGLVSGRIKQGDLVDILFTSKDNSTGGVYSALILQHVQVLGIDGGASGTASAGMYQVTVLVTPQQALDLTLAKRRGTLDLALTPPNPDVVNLQPASPLKFIKTGDGE